MELVNQLTGGSEDNASGCDVLCVGVEADLAEGRKLIKNEAATGDL